MLLSAGYVILVRIGRHLIFRPQLKCWPLQLPFQHVSFWGENSTSLTGIYLPAQKGFPTLLFFHGRGGNVSHFEKFALSYAPLGYGIFMFDYRGYGNSKGTPSQKSMFEDALAATRYLLHTQKCLPQEVVLFGHSLGCAPALHTAKTLSKLPWKALVLQSPFLSTPDMAVSLLTGSYAPRQWFSRFYKRFASVFLLKNHFDNLVIAKGIRLPTWVCMTKKDATIPWEMSHRLSRSIPGAQAFISPEGRHDEFHWACYETDRFIKKLSK